MQYRELFSLRIRHDYYLDRNCPDFTLSPTPDCEQLLSNYKLVVKAFPYGVQVLAPVRLDESGGGNPVEVPFVNIPADARFDFWLRLNNSLFSTFTDLGLSFGGKKLSRPVFSNENLAGAGVLEVKEMQASRTEYLKVPDDLPEGKSDFVALLKDKPFRETASLHIFLDLDLAKRSGNDVVGNLPAPINDNVFRGFSITKMGTGDDPLQPLDEYQPLTRPFQFQQSREKASVAEGVSVPITVGVLITYHGPKPAPEVRIREVPPNDVNRPQNLEKAKFSFSSDGSLLSIFIRDKVTATGGGNTLWREVVEDWKNVTARHGFRLIQLGDGDKLVNDTGGFTALQIQDGRQLILPAGKDNGIRITYTGSHKTVRVKVLPKTDAADPPFLIEDESSPPALQEQPAGVSIAQYYPMANALRVAFSESDKGQAFQLHYPVRPALPWGVFGKVEVHNKSGFADFTKATGQRSQLFIDFIPAAAHWAYYIVSEVALADDELGLLSGKDKISFFSSGGTLTEVAFGKAFIDISNANALQWDTFRGNTNLPATIAIFDLEQIMNQLVKMENTLRTDGKLDKKRFLLVSQGKIPCRERYRSFLSLAMKDNVDLDANPAPGATLFQEIKSLPLPVAGGNEIKLIRIPSPERVDTRPAATNG